MTIDLGPLPPAAFDAWSAVFQLTEDFGEDWVVVGGQMVQLHAVELGATQLRPTVDVDVIVDVRARRAATEHLAVWLAGHDFELAGMSPEGIGHRYTREATSGPGTVVFDILAPEGLGERARILTTPPARTIEVPGGTQALARAEVVEVSVADMAGGGRLEGRVRRPGLLGAVVAKAAATTIPVRVNAERDWQDAALLLAYAPDPFEIAGHLTRKDRQRLRRLGPLRDRRHAGWALLDSDAHRRGVATLDILTH